MKNVIIIITRVFDPPGVHAYLNAKNIFQCDCKACKKNCKKLHVSGNPTDPTKRDPTLLYTQHDVPSTAGFAR